MEDVGIFYGHLVHFTVFCYILWKFGVVHGILVYFPVLVFCTKKNLATLPRNCLNLQKRQKRRQLITFHRMTTYVSR
jgi:cellobiose-specific phosphotransferase system component IIC